MEELLAKTLKTASNEELGRICREAVPILLQRIELQRNHIALIRRTIGVIGESITEGDPNAQSRVHGKNLKDSRGHQGTKAKHKDRV